MDKVRINANSPAIKRANGFRKVCQFVGLFGLTAHVCRSAERVLTIGRMADNSVMHVTAEATVND
jgi:hypothetical protein